MSKTLYIQNHSGQNRFSGWLRRGIDWSLSLPADVVDFRGAVDGRRFEMGRTLGTGARVIDVRIALEPGEAAILNFESGVAPADDETVQMEQDEVFIVPSALTLGGVPFGLRSTWADGAALVAHWRTRIGQIQADLQFLHYRGQNWSCGELRLLGVGPDSAAVLPSDFVLACNNFHVSVGGGEDGDVFMPAGESIGAGQGFCTLPVVITYVIGGPDLAAVVDATRSVGCVGLEHVWPVWGNPVWHPSRGSAQTWLQSNYPRATANMAGWVADPLGMNADAARTGREGDQVFVGAECGLGMESAGTELVNLAVAYGYARRPGKWVEKGGDNIEPALHPDLCLFEGYPFSRGGSKDTLGLKRVPNRVETHGWWEWREHWFRNRLFVAYRLTGSLALQWQIDQMARQYLLECTIDKRFTTSVYTGALRGFGWECLMAWWLHHTLEDRKLAAAVGDRWRARWELVGKELCEGEFWDVRRDDRLGPGLQWMAYQQAAAVTFIDMAGRVFVAPKACGAALRGAKAVLEHAFLQVDGRWVGYAYVPMREGGPVPLPEGAHYGPGIEAWMVGAPTVMLRHDHNHEQSREIVNQHIFENRENCQWISPDVAGL